MDESRDLHFESYDPITHEPQSGVEVSVYLDDSGKKVSAIGELIDPDTIICTDQITISIPLPNGKLSGKQLLLSSKDGSGKFTRGEIVKSIADHCSNMGMLRVNGRPIELFSIEHKAGNEYYLNWQRIQMPDWNW